MVVVLRIADLVDDDATKPRPRLGRAQGSQAKRTTGRTGLTSSSPLGLAKEGFDWIWCEHALTIGYRASLTEVVQIIGRATRDAPGKTRTRFTNLIAEPDAVGGRRRGGGQRHPQGHRGEPAYGADPRAALRVSRPKNAVQADRQRVFDYGPDGYDAGPDQCRRSTTRPVQIKIEIKGSRRAQER